MARVPQEELERLKAEVSVQRLVEAKGVELRRHGAHDLVGRCPFHDDREPSLVVSPSKNLWHCMGACQVGGSVVDWVMRAEKVSFRHAVELLRADLSFAANGTVRMAKRPNVRVLPAPVTPDADDRALLRQVVDYYHATLLEAPEARGYLASRGLDDRELLATFRLGFANRTLGLRLPVKTLRAGEEIRTRLQALGVLRESGHEHFNGSVVVPILDDAGDVAGMYGRKVRDDLRAGTAYHLYLPGPHRGVWNAAELRGAREVILCEALLDALTFWTHGLRAVTSSYGAEGFTAEHLDALTAGGVERVYIAYDRDAAGDKAAVQLATRLVAAGLDTFRVQFPRDLDANAYACLEPSTAGERLADAVRRAVWLGKGAAGVRVSAPPPSPAEPVTAAPGAADAPREAGQREAGEGVVAPASPRASDHPQPTLPPSAPSAPSPFAADLPAPPQEPAPTPPSPAAASTPAPTRTASAVEASDDELSVIFGERRWRARGLSKVASDAGGALRVNLLLRTGEGGERFHVDTLDLYVAKQRQAFVREAAAECGVLEETVRRDLGRVLLAVEEVLAERRRAAEEAERAQQGDGLSDEDRAAALSLLRAPDLLDRVVAAYDHIGVVGEATNALVAYLAATSRLLPRPLAVVVQSSSAAGKSALLEATLHLLPETARVKYSAMTGQSLYYMAEGDLAHKVLAVVEEQGAERAAYALKLLQSEGELRIASTGKDPHTGRLVTQDYEVRGPVALFLTTTASDVDEELLNRCLVLTVDEDRAQTRAIHQRQRERHTLRGLVAVHERQEVVRLHRAAQTLLRPLAVVNPYAPQLTFADARTRTRRDHEKYLTLIATVALLHQHQRPVQRVAVAGEGGGGVEVEYVEVIPADIAVANRLAHEVLGRSLDELPPQTRRLLHLVDELVRRAGEERALPREEVWLTRREVREHCGWGNSQLAVHLQRLVELEYLVVHAGGGRGRTYAYELAWDGQDEGEGGDGGGAVCAGLLDVEALRYDGEFPGQGTELPGSFRPHSGAVPAPVRGAVERRNGNAHKGFLSFAADHSANGTSRDDGAAAAVVRAAAAG